MSKSPLTTDFHKKDVEHKHEVWLVTIFISVGIFYLVALSILAFCEGNNTLGGYDLGLAVFLATLLFYLQKTRKVRQVTYLGLTIFLLFLLMLFSTGAANQQAFVWYYTYPLVALFLLGLRGGSVFSLLLISITAVIGFTGEYISFYKPYPSGFLLRLLASYLALFCLSFFYERLRQINHQKLNIALEKLNKIAIRDGLTGLYNRRYLDELCPLLLREFYMKKDAAFFMMIDLDYFKNYNDTYGHQAGDEVLIYFANLLQGLAKRGGDRVFRYGGEEFSVLLLPSNKKRSREFAEMILDKLKEDNLENKGSPFGRLTVSIGIGISPNSDKANWPKLLKSADEALYMAKEKGRNRYIFTD